MDLQTRIVNALVDQWPLVAGIGAVYYWLFPKMLKAGLMNGSGEVIRNIVRTENAEQTRLHAEELRKHEEREELRLTRLEDEVFRRRR
jgi:hypothetical protein